MAALLYSLLHENKVDFFRWLCFIRVDSDVTKGLNKGRKDSWKRPTGHRRGLSGQHSEKSWDIALLR